MRTVLWILGPLVLATNIGALAQGNCRSEQSHYDETAVETPVRITKQLSVKNSELDEWRPYSQFIEEIVYPDRMHLRSTRSDSKAWYENIQVGSQLWHRDIATPWSLTKNDERTRYMPEIKIRYGASCSVSTEIIDGSSFRLFTWSRGVVPEAGHEATDGGGLDKAWFFDNGRVLKKESLYFDPDNAPNRYMRYLERYEYDESIKIEPPVISP
jgi:hypothetical protein